MKKWFFTLVFRLFGWKVVGEKPKGVKKYLIVIAPHTSNVDFLLGVAARAISGVKSYYLAKKELFNLPLIGWFFKAIGGIAVDRSKNTNLVDQVIAILEKSEKEMGITVTPEGTRSYVEKWKTGFWYIAKNANIPIVMVGFDYSTKTVAFQEAFYAEEKESDIEKMKAYFRTVKGKYPEHGIR